MFLLFKSQTNALNCLFSENSDLENRYIFKSPLSRLLSSMRQCGCKASDTVWNTRLAQWIFARAGPPTKIWSNPGPRCHRSRALPASCTIATHRLALLARAPWLDYTDLNNLDLTKCVFHCLIGIISSPQYSYYSKAPSFYPPEN